MKIYVASFLLLCASSIHAQSIITYFIKPYFAHYTEVDQEKLRASLTIPGKLAKKILRHTYSCSAWADGIFNSYYGYLSVSDCIGQVIFPRKHQKNTFNILITERIQPIMMIGNTVHHWIIEPTVPAKLYSLKLNANNTEWTVEEIKIPENSRITLDTIIIFANPKDIYVAIGKKKNVPSPNITFPNIIFAKKGLNRISSALWILKMRHFFGPIIKTYKQINPTYFSEMLMQS